MFRHYRVHCDFRSNSRRLCCNWRPINRDTRSGEGIFPTYLYSFSLTFDYGGVQTTSRIKREPWRIDSLLKDQSRGVPVSLPQPCPLVTHFSTRFKIYDSKSYSMFMYRRNFGHYLCVSSSQALCSMDEAISKAARTTISHWYKLVHFCVTSTTRRYLRFMQYLGFNRLVDAGQLPGLRGSGLFWFPLFHTLHLKRKFFPDTLKKLYPKFESSANAQILSLLP